MASPTKWTWVWINSRRWWWTGRPGMLQSMGEQSVRHGWATELTDFAISTSWSEPQSAPSLVFCWLYRASPSSAAKNIINLILVLTIWWCPYVESSSVLLFVMTNVFSWQNSVRLCPASFCTLRLTLPVTYIISWLPSFAVQSHMMKRTFFFGVNSRRSGRSSWNHSVPTSSKLVVGA